MSGLGGEYGYQAAYKPGIAAVNYDPAIVTTDLIGCARGYNANGDSRNALTTDASAIDNTCNYTGNMNGTSAATPTSTPSSRDMSPAKAWARRASRPQTKAFSIGRTWAIARKWARACSP